MSCGPAIDIIILFPFITTSKNCVIHLPLFSFLEVIYSVYSWPYKSAYGEMLYYSI